MIHSNGIITEITRHSENNHTPEPIGQRMDSPLLGPQVWALRLETVPVSHWPMYLDHGQAYMGKRAKYHIPEQIGQDNSIEIQMEKSIQWFQR